MAIQNIVRTIVPMALSYIGSGGSLIFSSIAQLVTFAVLARYLGADEFALYVTITAFTNVAVQLCGLGTQEPLTRRVAQNPADHARMMGHSLIMTAGTGAVLLVVGLVALPLLVPVSPDWFVNIGAIALLLISTVLILRFISLATAAYIGRSAFAVANTLEVAFGLLRMAAALVGCLAFGVATVAEWAVWFFAAHVLAGLAAAWLIWRLGRPRFELVRDEVRTGILFSTQFVLRAVRQNTDVVVLGLFTSPEIVASYGVARRVLDSSFLSIEALNRLIYPGSAVLLMSGFHGAARRMLKVFLAGGSIAIAVSLVVYLLAPLMPLLFGKEYTSLVAFTQVICWVLLPVALAAIALEVFGAAGRQEVRAAIYNGQNIVATALGGAAAALAGAAGAFGSLYVVEITGALVATTVLYRFVAADRDRALTFAPAE